MPYEEDYKMWLEKMLIESNPDWVCDGMYDVGLTHEWCEKYCGEDSEYVTPKCLHMFYHHIARADRNSSEKPNFCEYAENPSGDVWECGCFLDTYCEHQIYDRNPDGTINIVECGYEPKDEPTISKMEQVEDEPQKEIKGSKRLLKGSDKPQQKSCATCKHALGNWDGESNNCGRCCGADRRFYEPKDKPQTDTEIAKAIVHKMIDDAVIAEDAYPDLRQKMHDAVDEYEPQTECTNCDQIGRCERGRAVDCPLTERSE